MCISWTVNRNRLAPPPTLPHTSPNRLVIRFLLSLLFRSELVSSLSGDPGVAVSGSAQSLSVRAWVRCVLQQHLHKNPDGTDSRTGNNTQQQFSTYSLSKKGSVYINVNFVIIWITSVCVFAFVSPGCGTTVVWIDPACAEASRGGEASAESQT